MARKVAQELRGCENCGRDTLHYRNTKEMSWLVHLVLAIFTAGVWLLIWGVMAFYHVLTKPIGGKWTCSVCGGKGPSPDTHVRCPDCRELVLMTARTCKHCGCKLVPQA